MRNLSYKTWYFLLHKLESMKGFTQELSCWLACFSNKQVGLHWSGRFPPFQGHSAMQLKHHTPGMLTGDSCGILILNQLELISVSALSWQTPNSALLLHSEWQTNRHEYVQAKGMSRLRADKSPSLLWCFHKSTNGWFCMNSALEITVMVYFTHVKSHWSDQLGPWEWFDCYMLVLHHPWSQTLVGPLSLSQITDR